MLQALLAGGYFSCPLQQTVLTPAPALVFQELEGTTQQPRKSPCFRTLQSQTRPSRASAPTGLFRSNRTSSAFIFQIVRSRQLAENNRFYLAPPFTVHGANSAAKILRTTTPTAILFPLPLTRGLSRSLQSHARGRVPKRKKHLSWGRFRAIARYSISWRVSREHIICVDALFGKPWS